MNCSERQRTNAGGNALRFPDDFGLVRTATNHHRAETVSARPVSHGLAVTLEILINRPIAAAVIHIMVTAVGVALPDLDPRAGDRPPSRLEQPPADVGDNSVCGTVVAGNVNQVVVRIRRERARIKRSCSLRRGRRQHGCLRRTAPRISSCAAGEYFEHPSPWNHRLISSRALQRSKYGRLRARSASVTTDHWIKGGRACDRFPSASPLSALPAR